MQVGNINFYLPLTAIAGTSSLAVESAPGVEDFGFLALEYGQVGGLCRCGWGARSSNSNSGLVPVPG